MWRMLFLGAAPALVFGSGPTLGSDGVLHAQLPRATWDGTQVTGSHSLYAVTSDGKTRWIFDTGSTLGPHAEGWNNTVYVTTSGWNETDQDFSDPGFLFALDGLDGSIKWKYQVGGNRRIDNSLVVATDGTVYLTSCDDSRSGLTLDAIDTAGALMWTVNVNTSGIGEWLDLTSFGLSAVGPDGTLYVQGTKSLDAIQPTTGTVKWSAANDARSRHDVLTIESNVFVLEINGTYSVLSKLNNEDGSVLWNYSLSACNPKTCDYQTETWMVLGSNDEVYVNGVTLRDGTCSLSVFDFNGNALRNLPCLEYSSRYCSEEDLFITARENVLARRGTDGLLLWNVSVASPDEDVNFGQNGTIFVESRDLTPDSHDSTMYAIRRGKLAWRVQIGGPLQQVMSEDGTTYVQGWLCPKSPPTRHPLHTHPHPSPLHGFPHPPGPPPDCLSGPPVLEVVAVGADGVEKWRYTPTEAVAEFV